MKPPQPEPDGPARTSWDDERLDQIIGSLLRIGVLVAAAVVFLGGMLYLIQYGRAPSSSYAAFEPHPEQVSLRHIIKDVKELRSRGLIALGLLLLIATPVARVLVSSLAFLLQRDFLYVGITLLVLAILLFSLMSGQAE